MDLREGVLPAVVLWRLDGRHGSLIGDLHEGSVFHLGGRLTPLPLVASRPRVDWCKAALRSPEVVFQLAHGPAGGPLLRLTESPALGPLKRQERRPRADLAISGPGDRRRSVRLAAQVVPVASEVEVAQLGLGLSEQIVVMGTSP